jgi:hypothetical protein
MDENPYESPQGVEPRRFTVPRGVWIRQIEYPIALALIVATVWILWPEATSAPRNRRSPVPNSQADNKSADQTSHSS